MRSSWSSMGCAGTPAQCLFGGEPLDALAAVLEDQLPAHARCHRLGDLGVTVGVASLEHSARVFGDLEQPGDQDRLKGPNGGRGHFQPAHVFLAARQTVPLRVSPPRNLDGNGLGPGGGVARSSAVAPVASARRAKPRRGGVSPSIPSGLSWPRRSQRDRARDLAWPATRRARRGPSV